jgi:hypothetical protein
MATFYDRVEVTAKALDGTPYDPTTEPVAIAYTPLVGSVPTWPDANTVWHSATWEVVGSAAVPTALLLIGASAPIQLPIGNYARWVRVTSTPELDPIPAGVLQIG